MDLEEGVGRLSMPAGPQRLDGGGILACGQCKGLGGLVTGAGQSGWPHQAVTRGPNACLGRKK